jgi:nicotinate-nucleotide adenylyltransferase
MRIGLYFGSFNPIHHGHLIIANHILNSTDLQEVWFVVSPQNPFKNSSGLLNEQHRLRMVQIAIEGETRLRASNAEFKLPKPSYTIHTMSYLEELHPDHQFSIIMGSDGYQNISKWKNYEKLLDHYTIYIYKRPGFEIQEMKGAKTITLDAPLLQISSTHIRELIRDRKSIRYLVPDSISEEIEKNNYYRSSLENPAK